MLTQVMEIWWVIGIGGAVMALALLRGVGSASVAQAQVIIDIRREREKRLIQENALAEAAGRAAALEPLNLNADGTIEEPIIGVVEK